MTGTKDVLILDTALELFEARGYGATPVPLLAERAGVGAGTIYRYFPGKEGVVNALYRRWKTALAEGLLDGLDPTEPAAAVFAGVWRRLCRFVIDHPVAFAFLETHHHHPYLDADSRAVGERLDLAMSQLVAEWQRTGAVRQGDPGLMVAQVYGGLVGVVRALRDRGAPLPDDLADLTLDAAWSQLAPGP